MSSSEIAHQNRVNHNQKSKTEFKDGQRNWIIVILMLLSCNFLIDNVSRHGIKHNPIEIITIVATILIENWWFYLYTLGYYFQQILQMFAVEKSLAMGLISDKVGLTLHATNTWYLPLATIITLRTLNGNPFVARFMMTYVLFVTTKVWSYAYVNFTYRKALHKKETLNNSTTEDNGKETVKYPKNVTFENVITYMVFTPPIEYRAHFPERTKPNFLIFLKLLVELFLIYCVFAFLVLQFVYPEVIEMKANGGNYADMVKCLFRIAVPMHLVWFVYNPIQIFAVLLPGYAIITGMKDVKFTRDWWNSGNMTMFWRKWNLPVHNCLKFNVGIPLMSKGYGQFLTNIVCFAIAGIIHEYLNSWPFGLYDGVAMMVTMGEMVGGTTSSYIEKTFGSQFGNMLVWLYTIMTVACGVVHLSIKVI